jgi:DNA-binding MarR family transcriptional regulator
MSVEIRPAQALKLAHDVAFAMVLGADADDVPDFSMRQLAMLLTIYLEPPPHTVRGLAKKLNVTKPVITRGLDTMGKHELVTRRRDETDRRNVLIQRTVKGALFVEKFGDLVVAKAKDLPR